MHRCQLLLLATASLAACDATREEPAGSVAAWEVAAEPRIDIGDREDTDSVTFYRVDDARWHAARGLLVIADGGAQGIRVYAPDGELRARGGRRGQGPGEFTGRLALVDAPGDSVAVWDSGQGRWTMFNVLDGGMRNVTGEYVQPTWFQAGMLVVSDAAEAPAWLRPLLMRTDSASSRVARVDRNALAFVSQDARLRAWRVHRDSLAPIASVTLPEGFQLTHIADDMVVGVVSDSLGLQRVAVHDFRRGTHEPSDRTPAAVAPEVAEAGTALRSYLRNMVVAQEMRFATAGGYTAFADSLQMPPPPAGARVRIIEQTERGWSGVAWLPSTGFTCGMIVGLTTPPGWMEGEARCGR